MKTFGKSGALSLKAASDMLGAEKLTLRAWMRKSLEAPAESPEQVNNLERSYGQAFVTTAPPPAPGAPVPQAYLHPQLYPQHLMLPRLCRCRCGCSLSCKLKLSR